MAALPPGGRHGVPVSRPALTRSEGRLDNSPWSVVRLLWLTDKCSWTGHGGAEAQWGWAWSRFPGCLHTSQDGELLPSSG